MNLKAAVLTISDRCSKGEADDKSGPALNDMIKDLGWEPYLYKIIPDDKELIKNTISEWANNNVVSLILTTGGTGIGKRDFTPEATLEIIEKELPGFSELIRMEGYKITKNAVLSRGVSGIKNNCVIINLPGSTKGATESFGIVKDLVAHAVDMLLGKDHK